ncbi:trp operon leader peptide [Streptomyces coeruleorubidus]|uniref:Trp operon leader peptide n=3 Tax=Streptomyces TaxID=1883 RepID=A0A5J6I2Q5_STRC4|nr:trp operon leader peptide [Streptomyces coeruleorubidus]
MSGVLAHAQQLRHGVHDSDMGSRTWGRVPAMFAHSIQTWWWTAHPAAH